MSRLRLAHSSPSFLLLRNRQSSARPFSTSLINMGVTKQIISEGNGTDKAKKGDTITMEYTGNLQDANAANGKGKQYVSGRPQSCATL